MGFTLKYGRIPLALLQQSFHSQSTSQYRRIHCPGKENHANKAKKGLVYTNVSAYWLAPWYYGYQGRFLTENDHNAQLDIEPLVKALELTLGIKSRFDLVGLSFG